MSNIHRVADNLKQASDATRLQVMILLLNGEYNVHSILTELNMSSQAVLSHHLGLLRAAGIVEQRRDGRRQFYSLTKTGRQLAEAVS